MHPGNVRERAELLLEQYGKTGSLFPHNVVLVPLGDDFTYNHPEEFDQQYANYNLLMNYINSVSVVYKHTPDLKVNHHLGINRQP